MKTMDTYNFSGKKAIMRVDFNVPLNSNFDVTDNTRIKAAIPTIKKILSDGGSVILMSHLGRPKNGPEDKFSLKHIVSELEKLLGNTVDFVNDCTGNEVESKSAALENGKVLLLENLRFYKEETNGDKEFAQKLANLADVYVNDAFGTAHRAHASTAIIADFFPEEKLFGYLIQNELDSIDKVMHSAEKPFTAIVGGAKVSSKIEIITQLLEKVDHIVIGGGMSYTFAKALGGKVGNSLVEDDYLDTAKKIMEDAEKKGKKIHIPVDTIVADAFDNNANTKACLVGEIEEGWMGLDIADETISNYKEVLLNSKTILWNGPMGVFEMSSFEKGTKEVALAVAEATKKGAFSLIGGGDSVAAINKYNLANEVSYVSTGGGALLEYMEGKELPGIAAIRG